MKFERIIQAALSETRSKFALAEALAIEIPPRRSGQSDDDIISSYLAKAIQAISDAGGEPRAVGTMADYRKTALWVQGVNAPNFRWVKETSFTAHNEARKVGLSYKDFAAMPLKTTDAIRGKAGKAGTDGPPSKIIDTWTPAQRVEAVREAVKDPNVARAVIADRATNTNLAKARQEYDQEIQAVAESAHPALRHARINSEQTTTEHDLIRMARDLDAIADQVDGWRKVPEGVIEAAEVVRVKAVHLVTKLTGEFDRAADALLRKGN